jgi:uncharacterized protein with PhoU and TrkA domain
MTRILAITLALAATASAYDSTKIADINNEVKEKLDDIRKDLAQAREAMHTANYGGDKHKEVLNVLMVAESDLKDTKHADGNAKAKAETVRLAKEIVKLRNETITEALPFFKQRVIKANAVDGGTFSSDWLNTLLSATHNDARVKALVTQCGCKIDKDHFVDCVKPGAKKDDE